MEESQRHGVDSAQVKKAVQALLAYQKSKEKGNKLLLNENDRILLMVTVWKIPNRPEVIRIPLPHGIRPDSCEVCLFTKDEPNMSSDQTEKFYKKLFAQHGITNINEIIPYKRLKTEYKPYEAKRRLLGSFDLFLADSRIRRLLPSHLGKHFYKEKREPQSVNLKSKRLASELNRFIQGTQLHVTNKGCCYSIRVGHTGMKAEDIVENAVAVADVLAEKLPMKWKNIKVLHLKTQKSVSLPVYNSPIGTIKNIQVVKLKKKKKPAKEKKPTASTPKKKSEQATPDQDPREYDENEEEEDQEDIPELVPIVEPDSPTSLLLMEADKQIQASTPKQSGKKRKISDDEGHIDPQTPSKNKKESNEEPQTPSKHIEEPKEEVKTPSKNIEEPTEEAKTLSKHKKESNEEAKTPSRNKKESKKDAKPPSKNIEEPNEKAKTPSKNKKESNKGAKTPSKYKKDSHEEAKTPSKNEKESDEEAKTPSKNIEEPNEEPQTPSTNNDDQVSEHESGNAVEQESAPEPGNLRKTPKKSSDKSAKRLAKSAKKAPLTPKLKKKKLKPPQSV